MEPIPITDRKIDQAAELLKILAHPMRMRIILLLAEHSTLNVSELYNRLQVDQSLLSNNLIKMKDKGVLVSKRQGQEVHYSLADTALSQAITVLLNKSHNLA